jgi:hypothetical protein
MAKKKTTEQSLQAVDYACSLIEAALPQQPAKAAVPAWEDLPRRAPEELDALALSQGASLAVNLDDLRGDFWPADESSDEFIAAIRRWRREGLNDWLPPSR